MANQMPPSTLSDADLYLAMAQLPRPHKVVDFPRKRPDGSSMKLAMVPLTARENSAATVQTEVFVRGFLKEQGIGVPTASERSEGYTTLYENRASIEILFRASKRVEDVKMPFFPAVDKILDLTVDEQGVLFRQYMIVCGELGPIVSQMSKQEYDAWLEKLAKGGSRDPLAFLTSAAKNDLLMYSASLLYPSPTDSSSSGEPPVESGGAQ